MTRVDVTEIVKQLLEQGFQPRDIRRQLAARGIRWEYRFSRYVDAGVAPNGQRVGRRVQHQGEGERARRRRQQGLCETGCGRRRASGNGDMCFECLSEKWGGQKGLGVERER